MMLEIIGQKICGNVSVQFGDYVPFKIRCEAEKETASLYWRTGDLDLTMLEVEICPVYGQIIGVSLLLSGRVGADFPALYLPPLSSRGFPLVRIDAWPSSRFIDEKKSFQIFTDLSRLLILIGNDVASRSIYSDNITFGVCEDGSLSWILVDNLNSEKLVHLMG